MWGMGEGVGIAVLGVYWGGLDCVFIGGEVILGGFDDERLGGAVVVGA